MASFKKPGQIQVRKGQVWKSIQRGTLLHIVAKGKRGQEWIGNINRKSHHVATGTILKYFTLVK